MRCRVSRAKKTVLIMLLLVAIAIGVWASWHNGEDKASSFSNPAPIASTLAPADVNRVEAGLISQNPAIYKATWAIANTPPLAPVGTSIKIDASSLRISNHTGEVRATGMIPGKQPVTIVIKLVSVNGRWLVGAMEEVK